MLRHFRLLAPNVELCGGTIPQIWAIPPSTNSSMTFTKLLSSEAKNNDFGDLIPGVGTTPGLMTLIRMSRN
jgi:hypothetical protein